MTFSRKNLVFLIGYVLVLSFTSVAHSSEGKSALITESYYTVKWGYFDEFVALFKKNHYPLLKEMKRLGHVESIVIDYPTNHAGEEDRWDIRVTVIIPDTAAYKRAMAEVSSGLYPDQETLKQQEIQRFRLLLGHQDIMIRRQNLSTW